MCRIAAYLGEPIALTSILESPHGLVQQSYAPRRMHSGVVNADGWGVGWFADFSDPRDPRWDPRAGLLKGVGPIWSDENAAEAAPLIRSGSFLGVVRSASPGLSVGWSNTPPYRWGGLGLFAHNGLVSPWSGPIARAVRARLDDQAEAELRGSTDSELLAAWLLTLARATQPNRPEPDDQAIPAALRELLAQLTTLVRQHQGSVLANLFLLRRGTLWATRFAEPGPAPSLFLLRRNDQWPGTVLASEPLDDDPGWIEAPTNSLIHASAGEVLMEPLRIG